MEKNERCDGKVITFKGYRMQCELPAGHDGRHEVGAISSGEDVW